MQKIALSILLLILVAATLVPVAHALSPPTVNLPNNWFLEEEAPYPDYTGWHDPQGAGRLKYVEQDGNAYVAIYYENALGTTYSSDSLKEQATMILLIFQNASELTTGVMNVAGVPAGYAKNYYPDYDDYYLRLVLVKNNYYLDVSVAYDANYESQAMSLVNSINVAGDGATFPSGFILVGAIIAVIAVAILIVVFKKRKRA